MSQSLAFSNEIDPETVRALQPAAPEMQLAWGVVRSRLLVIPVLQLIDLTFKRCTIFLYHLSYDVIFDEGEDIDDDANRPSTRSPVDSSRCCLSVGQKSKPSPCF